MLLDIWRLILITLFQPQADGVSSVSNQVKLELCRAAATHSSANDSRRPEDNYHRVLDDLLPIGHDSDSTVRLPFGSKLVDR